MAVLPELVDARGRRTYAVLVDPFPALDHLDENGYMPTHSEEVFEKFLSANEVFPSRRSKR